MHTHLLSYLFYYPPIQLEPVYPLLTYIVICLYTHLPTSSPTTYQHQNTSLHFFLHTLLPTLQHTLLLIFLSTNLFNFPHTNLLTYSPYYLPGFTNHLPVLLPTYTLGVFLYSFLPTYLPTRLPSYKSSYLLVHTPLSTGKCDRTCVPNRLGLRSGYCPVVIERDSTRRFFDFK